MNKSQPKGKKAGFLGVVFVLVVLLGLSLFSLFYFNQDSLENDGREVKFWLYRRENQLIGQEGTFFVFIKNQEVADLKNVEITINFPESFQMSYSFPECQEKLVQGGIWKFEKIKKNQLQEIEIKGKFLGAADQIQNFVGRADFLLTGFSSLFQKNFSSAVVLDPTLSLTWETPEQSSFGQIIKSFISLENISDDLIVDSEVILNYPQEFVIDSAELADSIEGVEINSNQRQVKWKIKNLNSKEKRKIEFTGFVQDPNVSEINFDLKTGILYQGNFYLQQQKEKKIFYEKINFPLTLEIDNSLRQNQSADWGNNVLVTFSYKNETNEIIKDFSLKFKIDGEEYLDFSKFYQTNWRYYKTLSIVNQPVYISGKITPELIENGWTIGLIPEFNQIAPQKQGTIAFEMPIKQALQIDNKALISPKITLDLIALGKLGKQEINWGTSANKIYLFLNTQALLKAEARYYNDEKIPLGSGPLPLEKDKETSFWIFWEIKNTNNPIKNILVASKLPLGIEWTGKTKTSQGIILYQIDKNEVNWKIDELDAYQGGPYSLVEGAFEIKIKPSQEQLNTPILLTQEIFFTAQDKTTDNSIFQNIQPVDSSLKDDPWFQELNSSKNADK